MIAVKKKVVGSDFMLEAEVGVDDFDRGADLLAALGLKKAYYVEKLRDVFNLGDAEVVFDTYPGLPPFIEVEAPTEEKVDAAAARLNLRPDDPQNYGAGHMYRDLYGIPTDRPQGDLTFNNVISVLGPMATKGKVVFEARAKGQQAEADRLRKSSPPTDAGA